MRFIKKTNLAIDLDKVPPEVKNSAIAWLAISEDKNTKWNNFADVRKTFARASIDKDLYIFNIKDYRLIVGISFSRQIIYYKTILSHPEYDKNEWKKKFSRTEEASKKSKDPKSR